MPCGSARCGFEAFRLAVGGVGLGSFEALGAFYAVLVGCFALVFDYF